MIGYKHPLQVNVLGMTLKGITRRFRKALHAAGHWFPLQGPFSVKVSGKMVNDPAGLPANLARCKVEILPGVPAGTILAVKVPKKVVAVVETTDRQLYKKSVREADPAKPNSKRRIDYRLAKNPKAGDGVTYYAKIEGKWKEVPVAYADPSYTLSTVAA